MKNRAREKKALMIQILIELWRDQERRATGISWFLGGFDRLQSEQWNNDRNGNATVPTGEAESWYGADRSSEAVDDGISVVLRPIEEKKTGDPDAGLGIVEIEWEKLDDRVWTENSIDAIESGSTLMFRRLLGRRKQTTTRIRGNSTNLADRWDDFLISWRLKGGELLGTRETRLTGLKEFLIGAEREWVWELWASRVIGGYLHGSCVGQPSWFWRE